MEKKITAPRSVYKGRVCEEKKIRLKFFTHFFEFCVAPNPKRTCNI